MKLMKALNVWRIEKRLLRPLAIWSPLRCAAREKDGSKEKKN